MKFLKIILYCLFFCFSISCSWQKEPVSFYFTKNYPGDNWENHKTGLLWTLSYLGAKLPVGSLDKAISWKDSSTFRIDFKNVGFGEEALKYIEVICDSLKQTSHYQSKGAADIGAFVALTIGCSNHYYKITSVPGKMEDLLRQHQFNNPKVFSITKSSVANHHRVIKYSELTIDPRQWIFIAEEGNGDVRKGDFTTEYYEVLDIMSNGQLRCMVYDKKGNLVPASPKELGEAGKPAKCLWCHEIVIQPLFEKTDSLGTGVSLVQFQKDIIAFMTYLKRYRDSLKSDLDFNKTQDHTQMELEYISYMQPSIKKLAIEWDMNEKETKELLKAVNSSEHEEFKFLGKVFHRKEVKGLRTLFPESIREPNIHEINFFK